MDRIGELLGYLPEALIFELLAFLNRKETGRFTLNVKEGKIIVVDVERTIRV